MPVNYTNRKQQTYVLCQGTTKTGKPRYYFTREPKGETVNTIPEGYHIEESVNGVVSLVKDRPRLISAEELAAVETALRRHPRHGNHTSRAKGNEIVVYERELPDIAEIMARLGRAGRPDPRLVELLGRSARYSPVMRFVLVDREKWVFAAERWHFSGSIDDWIDIGHSGQIEALARRLIRKLGTDAFFELG